MALGNKSTVVSPDRNIAPSVLYEVKFDAYKSEIAVMDAYCKNPKCTCRNVTLIFVEIEDHMTGDDLFSIQLDIDSWDIKSKKIIRNDLACGLMIQEFMKDLDEDIKRQITVRFNSVKKFDGEYLREKLDYDLINNNSCIYYTDIFNDKDYDKFVFDYMGKQYVVLDQYCTNPKCKCDDTVLVFFQKNHSNDTMDSIFAIRLKFKIGTYMVEDIRDGIDHKELNDIYSYFIKNLNTVNFKLFKERYKRMKRVRLLLDEPIEKPVERTDPVVNINNNQKAGRNDPCPCGSGLKYKKCCGI